jgi:GxxExxY protein
LPIGVSQFCSSFPSFSSVTNQVHPKYQRADKLSYEAIGAALEVHRIKGAGLLESIYERCMMREFELRQVPAVNQQIVTIEYKGLAFDEPLRFDVLVDNCLLLELKSVKEVLPIHKAQLLSYMKLLDVPVGLIINFHETKLTNGISRMILPGANQ